MWDLETLRYLNEQAYLSSLKLVNEGISQPTATTEQSKPSTVFPLAILSYRLIVGPPSLSRVIDIIEGSDSIAYFLELIREYLPNREADIMARMDDAGRIQRFTEHFNQRYFPLSEEFNHFDDYTIADFTRQIPVELMGFSWDDYEGFNSYRDGFVLMLALIETPYDEEERVPLLERAKELVGKGLVEQIPVKGFDLDEVHRLCDGNEYEGFVAFADWIHSCTECWQLDANYGEYTGEDWSPQIIEELTRQWPRVIDIQDKMHQMYEWIEEDLFRNFQKLLSVMLGIEYETVPREQMPLPLDEEGQVIGKEVTAVGR